MGSIMTKLFGTTYQVVENPNEDDAGIEILEGEWKGLVYQYGKVQFEDGKPNVNFQRTIRRLPESGEGMNTLINNKELNTLMGEILKELLEEKLKHEQRDIEETDKET
jgi:hypothetical protein